MQTSLCFITSWQNKMSVVVDGCKRVKKMVMVSSSVGCNACATVRPNHHKSILNAGLSNDCAVNQHKI